MSSINTEKLALRSIKTKPSEELRLSSRRLSRQFPIPDYSLDVYYRESSVGVPFVWESQPGTPKIKTREFPLLPLTPPPSFHATPISRKHLKKQPRNNLVTGVFLPKLNLKNTQFEQSPSRSMSSLSSSPWSTASSPLNELNQRRISSPPRMSVDSSFGSTIEEDERESPVSTLCFRGGRSARGRSRGCSSTIVRLLLGELS